MQDEIDMEEVIELRNSAKELCDIFGFLHDVKNERHLLNLVFFAQKQKIMDEIYSDFRLSDLGPFSPDIDFDLEMLKWADMLEETDDPKNTIYLTVKGKKACEPDSKKFKNLEKVKELKNLSIDELVAINRYIYLLEKEEIEKNEYDKLMHYFNLNDSQVEKIKQNVEFFCI